MDERLRWIVAIVAVAALIGLILLARGLPDHGGLAMVVIPLARLVVGLTGSRGGRP